MFSSVKNLFENPRHGSESSTIQRLVYTKAENDIPSTFDGSDVVFRPKYEQMDVCGSHVVEWELKETGGSSDLVVCPAPFFSKEILIKKNDGNVKVVRSFPEANFFHSVAGLPDEKQNPEYLKQLGLNKDYWTDATIKKSSSRKFYTRLWESDDEFVNSYVKNDRGYTEIIITLASDIKSSGGTVGITNIRLITTDIKIPRTMMLKISDPNTERHRRALYWHEIKEQALTLTAGTETEIKLNKIRGHCPFLLVAIRDQNYSATNSANHKFHALGDGATLNVKSYDRELLSLGQDMPVEYLQNNVWLEHCNSDFNKRNMYVIPFCRSVKEALKGQKSGYFPFDGSQQNVLHITPASAGVSQVQTITQSEAPTGGYFKLSFKGDVTDSLVYNATVGAVKTALEALPSFKNYPGKPLTVTLSAQLSAGATPTLTFDSTAIPPTDLVQVIAENSFAGAGGAVNTATVISTEGKQGWTTGTYDLRVYAPVYQRIRKKHGMYAVSTDM